jgi:ribonuclease HII
VSTTARRPASAAGRPTLRVERELQRQGYSVLVGMDEVGRGALAGPVSVGVVAVDATCRSAPAGVKDSKLLAAAAREQLVPRIHRWALGHGVGHAWPAEIDAIGIMGALRLAGQRALAQVSLTPDLVLLDGNHDWLTDPAREGLLGLLDEGTDGPPGPPVRTMVKADLRCSSVAAASVLAKVTRDAFMVQAAPAHSAYRWEQNKGYAAPEHLAALRLLGPSDQHRRSWRLTGTSEEGSAR